MINETTFTSLQILATGMISEQLASLTFHCPITSNNDVKHKNRKPKKSNEKDIRGNE